MKTAIRMLLFPLLAAVLPAQRPWQQVTVPSLREAAANFKAPPHEYGAIQPFISWNGPDAKERILGREFLREFAGNCKGRILDQAPSAILLQAILEAGVKDIEKPKWRTQQTPK